MKAGTLKKLVEALATDDGELETTYINVFLATYRSFSTPREVLKLLLERYEELASPPPNGRADQHEQHRKLVLQLFSHVDYCCITTLFLTQQDAYISLARLA